MINVLIVDDSAFMRQVFKKKIEQDPELNVVGTARNGADALDKIPLLKPDVITLDIEMPVKNGINTLQEIMALPEPIPVIMVSALDNRETVIKTLEIGAFDFIPKPSGSISLDIDEISEDLLSKIKAATNCKIKKSNLISLRSQSHEIKKCQKNNFPVVAIGSSSGGPRALKQVFSVFPADFPAGIIVVQHMPAGFTASFANHLDQASEVTVKEAEDGDMIKPGQALIAPGGYHLEITDSGRTTLNKKPTKWGVRPCVDYMMITLAPVFKERCIGIILTGMGHDGAQGMTAIKKYNGYGIVEDRTTALVYGMPSSTIKAGAYDEITPLEQIPHRIIDLIERRY